MNQKGTRTNGKTCSLLGRLSQMKISSLFKLFCNVKISPPNTPNFREAKVYKQDKLKRLERKCKKTLKNPQKNMRGLTLSDTKTYYKATVINTVWY